MIQLNNVYRKHTLDSDTRESERHEKETPCKQKPKESWSGYTNIR